MAEVNEPTVGQALKELHGLESQAYWRIVNTAFTMFQGYAPDLTVIFNAEVQIVFTPWSCGANDQRIFCAPTLNEAMDQVRQWHREQQEGSK